LSPTERQTLVHYEEIIAQGLKTFIEVGHALLAIREQGLYRETYGTFEGYLDQRWGLSRPHAYRLMDAAEVVDVVTANGVPAPANEAQARPLTSLPPAQQAEVWQEVVKTAPKDRITAKHVQATVKRLRDTARASRIQQERPGPDRALQAGQWRQRFENHFRDFEGLLDRVKQAGGVLVLVRDWDVDDQRRFVNELRAQAKTLQEMVAHFEKVIIGEEAALKAITPAGE
jgi:hypothetical protein